MDLLPTALTGPAGLTGGSTDDGNALAALSELVLQLPLAHMDDACDDLLGLLGPMRIESLPQKRRQEALQTIEPACTGLADRLEKAIRDVGLPLPPKIASRADQHQAICDHLVRGYGQMLAEQPPARTFIALPYTGQWVRACVHGMLWAERALTLQLRLHRSPAPELWLRLHGWYRQAQQAGLETKAVKLAGGNAALSAEQLYKRILLRAALPLAALSQEQWERVESLLTGWSADLRLSVCDPAADRSAAPVFLDPAADDGPRTFGRRCSDCSGGDCLLLGSQDLQAHFADEKAAIAVGLTPATLMLFRDALTFRPDRAEPRHQVDEPARALFGIAAVCNLLQEAKARRHNEPDNEGLAEEISYGNLENFHRGAFAGANLAGYDFINVLLCDISETGFRLEVLTKPGLQLKVGDLCGIQRRESRSLSAARIRWIRAEHGQTLTIGASFVAHRLRPATLISKPRGGEISRTPCFLGRRPEAEDTVIGLMPIPGILQRKHAVDHNGRKTRIALKSPPLDGSAGFELYQFRKKKRSRRRQVEPLNLPPEFDLNLNEDGSVLSELNSELNVESVDDLSGLSAFVGADEDET